MSAITTDLRAQGVAVLLAYWEGLREPEVRCTGYGDVTVSATNTRAAATAARVCTDANLIVTPLSTTSFVTRRHH